MKSFDTIYWVHAGWKAVTGVVIVVGASMPTVVLGWDTMLPSGKLVAVAGLVVAGWKSLDLAFDQMMRRVSQGKTPTPLNGNGGGGDTAHINKESATK